MPWTVTPDVVAVHLYDSTEVIVSGPPAMCTRPAFYVPSIEACGEVTDLIYSRWAQDQRPSLLVNILCGSNNSSTLARPDVTEALQSGLKYLIENLDVWILSCGLEVDPIARVAAKSVRNVAEERDYTSRHLDFLGSHPNDFESKPQTNIMLLGVNWSNIVPDLNASDDLNKQAAVANGWHTHFVLLDQDSKSCDSDMPRFRRNLMVHLAKTGSGSKSNTDERYVSFPLATPLTSVSEDRDVERQSEAPPCVCIFGASDLRALTELEQLIDCGCAVLVIQDASELCGCVRLAWDLYTQNARRLDLESLVDWLDCKLFPIANQIEQVPAARDALLSIFSKSVEGQKRLLNFCTADTNNMHSIHYHLVDTYLRSCSDDAFCTRSLLSLMVKLNLPELTRTINTRVDRHSPWFLGLFEEALRFPGRERMVQYFLDCNVPVSRLINVEIFLRLLKFSQHQDFLQSVILGHFLGYPSFPHDCRRLITVELNNLFEQLSFVPNVLPPAALLGTSMAQNPVEAEVRAHSTLVLWSLLMQRGDLAKLLWAHSHDPLPLALVLSQICRSLSSAVGNRFIYKNELEMLGSQFSSLAVELLAESYRSSPHRTYDALCCNLEHYGGYTVTQLAYLYGNIEFIASDSCQLWVTRLLHGQLQTSALHFKLPRWLKVLLSGCFVIPISFWFRSKHGPDEDLTQRAVRDRMRPTQSNCSMLSVRSLRQETLVMRYEPTMAEDRTITSATLGNGTFSGSASNVYAPVEAEEAEAGMPLTALSPESTAAPDDHLVCEEKHGPGRQSFGQLLCMFYCAPVTKYWLSLVLRIVLLVIFGISISFPGPGNTKLDLVVWSWSFIAWSESVWVLHLRRHKRGRWLGWHFVDAVAVAVLLLLFLLFKIAANQPQTKFGHPIIGCTVAAVLFIYLAFATVLLYAPMSATLGLLVARTKLTLARCWLNNFLVSLVLLLTCALIFVMAPQLSVLSDHSYLAILFTSFSLVIANVWLVLASTCATKQIDQEAPNTWKYEFYGLVTEFSFRPPLPPPFTPFAFLFLFSCNLCSVLRLKLLAWSSHPDLVDGGGHLGRCGCGTDPHYHTFWRSISRRVWSRLYPQTTTLTVSCDAHLSQPQMMPLLMQQCSKTLENGEPGLKLSRSLIAYPYSSVCPRQIPETHCDWRHVMPHYQVPVFNLASSHFPAPLRPFVDESANNERELTTAWKRMHVCADFVAGSRRSWVMDCSLIETSLSGMPLNPTGRKGMAGRGAFPRLGPNHYVCCVVFSQIGEHVRLLTAARAPSPFVVCNGFVPGNDGWSVGNVRSALLEAVLSAGLHSQSVLDYLRRTINVAGFPPTGELYQNCFGHVVRRVLQCSLDTDNAWAEVDVYVLDVDCLYNKNPEIGLEWKTLDVLKSQFEKCELEFVTKALAMF